MQGRGRAWSAMVAVGAVSVVAAAATSLALPASPGPALVDDAWISWRYAEHLAEGRGLVYNTGEAPVEGYTNLAWTLALALCAGAGVSSGAAMFGLGLASAAIAPPAVLALARALGCGLQTSTFAGLALAMSPHFAVVATNGLESASWVAAVCWTGVAVIAGPTPAAAVAVALLGTVRPEGAAVALAWVVARRDGDRRWLLGAWALGVAALSGWRLATYGRLVPNTWDAKLARPLGEQISFNLEYLRPDAPVWIAFGVALAVLPVALRRDRRRVAAYLAALLVTALAFRVDMWMPGARLLQPALALVLALVAAALDGRRAAWGLLAWAVVLPLTPWGYHPIAYDRRHTAKPDNAVAHAGRWLAEHLPPGAWLATRDAGLLAASVGVDVRVAELHERALTQPHPGGANARWRAYAPRAPEVVATTVQREDSPGSPYGPDRELLASLRVPYRYLGRVEQHHHRYYDVYVRADLDVPPLPRALVTNRSGLEPMPGNRPFPPGRAARPAAEGPNVVFVLACTTRRDQLTPYGGPPETTPFLDRLGRAGVVFDDAIAASSWTKESATAIFAGIPALDAGMADPGVGLGRRRLPDALTTLAEHLAAAGWWTGGVTANPHLDARFGFAQGMSAFDGTVEEGFRRSNKRSARSVVEAAVSQMASRSPADRARPAYLQITTIDPHYPVVATAPERAVFQLAGVTTAVADYRAMLRRMDDALAELERALVPHGLRPENTLWVVVSDHGEGLDLPPHHRAQHGRVLYDSLVRAAWIARGPGLPAGLRVSGLTSHLDVSPTVRGLAGLPTGPPPDPLAGGFDLAPGLRAGRQDTPRSRAPVATYYQGAARGALWTPDRACQADWGSSGIDDDTFVSGCFDRLRDPTFLLPAPDAALAGELSAWRVSAHARLAARGLADEAPRDDTVREQLEALGYAE